MIVCRILAQYWIIPLKEWVVQAKMKLRVFLEGIPQFSKHISFRSYVRRVPSKSVWRWKVCETVMVFWSKNKVPEIYNEMKWKMIFFSVSLWRHAIFTLPLMILLALQIGWHWRIPFSIVLRSPDMWSLVGSCLSWSLQWLASSGIATSSKTTRPNIQALHRVRNAWIYQFWHRHTCMRIKIQKSLNKIIENWNFNFTAYHVGNGLESRLLQFGS